jgi:hypothetical protein
MSREITGYAALATALGDDLVPVVDVHDTTMAATGTTKKITVSNLTAASAPLAGAVFTGAVSMAPVTLTDAATIAVNAALGNQFKVTLGGNRTLGAPSNAVNGQIITVWFTQDGAGSRTIALALSPGTSGGYWFGTDLTSITLSTAPGAQDKATFQYDSANARWGVTGFLRGF